MTYASQPREMPPKHMNGGNYGNEYRSPVTAEEYHSLMDNALRGKRLDEAWQVLERMQADGVKADKYAVSRTLMKTLSDSREHRKIYRSIALVERFVESQPEDADEVLFNSLLDACSRIQDVGRLEMTLTKMKEYGVAPSAVTLGILVKAFGRVGDMDRVLDVWKKMHHQHIVANAVTYGCMIDACVKCGNLQMAQDVFNELKRMKKHRNTIIYTTLIKGFGASKDKESALNLFQEMQDEGVPCNTITYNSVIDACVRCHDLQKAVEVFDAMLHRAAMNPKEKIEPDLITYSTMIKGYCHVGDLDRALDLSRQLDDRSLQADELVYNTLLDGCVRTNDLNTGVGLFEEMCTKQSSKLRNRLTPSAITFSILVRLYRRSGYQEEQAVAAVAHLFQAHGLPLREDNSGFRDQNDQRRGGNNPTGWSKGKGKGGGGPGMGPGGGFRKGGGKGAGYAQQQFSGWDESANSNMWSQHPAHFTNSPNGNDPVVQQAMSRGGGWNQGGKGAGGMNGMYGEPHHQGYVHGYDSYGATQYADYHHAGAAPPAAPGPGMGGPAHGYGPHGAHPNHMGPAYLMNHNVGGYGIMYGEEQRPEYMDWTPPGTPEQYASYPGY